MSYNKLLSHCYLGLLSGSRPISFLIGALYRAKRGWIHTSTLPPHPPRRPSRRPRRLSRRCHGRRATPVCTRKAPRTFAVRPRQVVSPITSFALPTPIPNPWFRIRCCTHSVLLSNIYLCSSASVPSHTPSSTSSRGTDSTSAPPLGPRWLALTTPGSMSLQCGKSPSKLACAV